MSFSVKIKRGGVAALGISDIASAVPDRQSAG
jgi:hypothetical protein